MTGQFDPNGSLRLYHQEQQKRWLWRTVRFCCYWVLGTLAAIVCFFLWASLLEGR